jgi:hypothetical protein
MVILHYLEFMQLERRKFREPRTPSIHAVRWLTLLVLCLVNSGNVSE